MERGEGSARRDGPVAPEGHSVRLGQRERRIIFREMVKGELQAGLLRGSKRKQLIQYAVHLGIPDFEAHLIVAQVQHGEGHLEPPRFLSPDEVQAKFEEARRYNQTMRRVMIAALGAVLLNALILDWFFL